MACKFLLCCIFYCCCCAVDPKRRCFSTPRTEQRHSWEFLTATLPRLLLKARRHMLGVVLRHFIFNPESNGVLQRDLLTTSNCNQTVVRFLFKGASRNGPLAACVAGQAVTTKWLFMLEEYNCFVTLWLFSHTTITVFWFSPLSSTECKSLRTFETDLFTMNKWKATSAKGDHYYLCASCLDKNTWNYDLLKNIWPFLLVSNANQNGLHLFTLPINCLFDLVTFHQNSINKEQKYYWRVFWCLLNLVIGFHLHSILAGIF